MAESHPQRRRRALADEALHVAARPATRGSWPLALTQRASAVSPENDTGELEQAATALRKLGSTRVLGWLYNNTAYNAIKSGRPEAARPFLATGGRARP